MPLHSNTCLHWMKVSSINCAAGAQQNFLNPAIALRLSLAPEPDRPQSQAAIPEPMPPQTQHQHQRHHPPGRGSEQSGPCSSSHVHCAPTSCKADSTSTRVCHTTNLLSQVKFQEVKPRLRVRMHNIIHNIYHTHDVCQPQTTVACSLLIRANKTIWPTRHRGS